MIDLENLNLFQTNVYTFKDKKYINNLKKISDNYLNTAKNNYGIDEIYPITQTDNFFTDPLAEDFANFIVDCGNIIVDSQGYDISYFNVGLSTMWFQEHRTGSGHDRHMHSGNILSGFYFIECPEDSCIPFFYDPRPAKEYGISLPLKNTNEITTANDSVFIKPETGLFIFSNSWMHHSISRNKSKDRFLMVHFDLTTEFKILNNDFSVEII